MNREQVKTNCITSLHIAQEIITNIWYLPDISFLVIWRHICLIKVTIIVRPELFWSRELSRDSAMATFDQQAWGFAKPEESHDHRIDLGDTSVVSECSVGVNLVIDNLFYVASGTSPLYTIWKKSDYYLWRYCILKIWGIWVSFGCDRSCSNPRRVSKLNSNVPQGGIYPHIKFKRDSLNIFRVRALTSSGSTGGRDAKTIVSRTLRSMI